MPEKYLACPGMALNQPGFLGHLFWFTATVRAAACGKRILILPRTFPAHGHNSGIPVHKQLHDYLSLEKTQVRAGGQPQPFHYVHPGDLDRKEKMRWTVAYVSSPNHLSSANLLIHISEEKISRVPRPPPYSLTTMTKQKGCKSMRVKLFPRQKYWQLAQETAQALGGTGNYYALHVRRGDRIRRAAIRGVDCDKPTRPKAIIERLRDLVPQGATLYLMSDEPDEHFFDPLKRHWQLARYWDFPQLERFVNQPNPLLADNHALFLIEGLIYCQAKLNIATYRKHRIKMFEQFFRFATPKDLRRNEHFLFEHYPAS